MESDPRPPIASRRPALPAGLSGEKEGQEVARDDQELLRVLGRPFVECWRFALRMSSTGAARALGQVRFEVGAHGVNRYAACDAKTRLKRDAVLHAPEVVLLKLDVWELAAGWFDQLFHELRSAPEFVGAPSARNRALQ